MLAARLARGMAARNRSRSQPRAPPGSARLVHTAADRAENPAVGLHLGGPVREEDAIPKSEGTRTKWWKYIRYSEPRPACEKVQNLDNDQHEEHNLADDPRRADVLQSRHAPRDELRDHHGGR